MSVRAIWTVFCDGDSKRCHFWIGEVSSKKEAKDIAREASWKRMRLDDRFQWLCPGCSDGK